ncbi:MAG TPA: PVC-type heme-binding CxxCH protein [Gemmataceae bacterium]|nr:PVC-type heme-binding CxxCH protein [Gemmataceae bacterium]
MTWRTSPPAPLLLSAAVIAALGLALLVPCDPARAQGYAPDEAVKKMTVAEGFAVKLVAAEPMVRQPVAIEFDERGRLWVIQYLQYPNPAGLKRVKVDRYSRTVYDRVPEPPPKGPKGADRITILSDFDRDGRAHKSKDFLGDLNLATGLAFGHGGVFVLQAPYLLFYPDRDRDDVPDADPDVLVKGFGMEDAHSVANSLTWGPDGWLYGCQGSTVTADIDGVEFQQGVWRYHPITRRFELFCEGGGNSWGLDFDRQGNLLYSTNVGGFTMLHGVQGAYYWKSFGKHGALHNPFAFGYIDHVPHRNFKGGHVTVGGIVYQGDSFPERFRGKYIAGDLLGHAVYWHDLTPDGSSFRSAHGGDLLLANDTWFATTDVTLGPDGSVYVADWFDKRTAHPDPDADWDRSNGRVYKIEAKGTKSAAPFDLAKLPSDKLVSLLAHRNDWFRRKARQVLADRRDPEVIFPLRTLVAEARDADLQLQALWALYVSGGFNDAVADKLLGHRNPDVRRWTVRFLGDERKVAPALAKRLADLAASEPDVVVRSQLACSARRLPAADGLPIVRRLLERNLDGNDPHIPLLLWWAVEEHAVEAREQVLEAFGTAEAWKRPLVRDAILERLMRRYAAEGGEAGYTACARLLTSAPAAERGRLLAALDQGLQDRPAAPRKSPGTLFGDHAVVEKPPQPRASRDEKLPPALAKQLDALWTDDTTDLTLIRLCARLNRAAAHDRAVALATDPKAPTATRLALLQALGDLGKPACVPVLLNLVGDGEPEAVQVAALEALQHFDREEIAAALLRHYPKMPSRLRARTSEVLLSRKAWAGAFLHEIDTGHFAAKDVPTEQLRVVALHRERSLDDLVRKHWGNIRPGTPEEKLAEMRRLSNDLRAGAGNPTVGRELFKKHCATCHKLFGEGEAIGPDLTHANRKDRDYLLVSAVDPSAVIRKEYLAYVVQTTDGRTLTGLIAEQTPGAVTLVDGKNQRTTVARGKIESMQESPVSLMPENLLKELKPQELRDLFSYLQTTHE